MIQCIRAAGDRIRRAGGANAAVVARYCRLLDRRGVCAHDSVECGGAAFPHGSVVPSHARRADEIDFSGYITELKFENC